MEGEKNKKREENPSQQHKQHPIERISTVDRQGNINMAEGRDKYEEKQQHPELDEMRIDEDIAEGGNPEAEEELASCLAEFDAGDQLLPAALFLHPTMYSFPTNQLLPLIPELEAKDKSITTLLGKRKARLEGGINALEAEFLLQEAQQLQPQPQPRPPSASPSTSTVYRKQKKKATTKKKTTSTKKRRKSNEEEEEEFASDNWGTKTKKTRKKKAATTKATKGGKRQKGAAKGRGKKGESKKVGPDGVFCLCRSTEEYGMMVTCDRCGGWYHASCVGIEEWKGAPRSWMCPLCQSVTDAATTTTTAGEAEGQESNWIELGETIVLEELGGEEEEGGFVFISYHSYAELQRELQQGKAK